MLRNFTGPPSPLFVQEDCKALVHASRFWHCIHLVEHVFKTAARPTLSRYTPETFIELHSLPYVQYPLSHLMVGVVIISVRSLCCALAHWPSDYMDVLCRFKDNCMRFDKPLSTGPSAGPLSLVLNRVCPSGIQLPGQWGWIENLAD